MKTANINLRNKITGIIIIAGLIVSILSSYSDASGIFSFLCGSLGGGCIDTAGYTLFQLPIHIWGIIYYILLGIIWFTRRNLLFYPVMAGAGAETALLCIMIKMKFVCFICALNLLLVLALFFCHFSFKRIYEMLSFALMAFILSSIFIKGSHNIGPKPFAVPTASTILAKIGNEVITAAEIEKPLTTKLYKIEKKIFRLRQKTLESHINNLLLEKEARTQGISIHKLQEKITVGILPPDSEIVDAYYRSEKYRRMGISEGPAAKVKKEIKDFLFEHFTEEAISDYCRKLKEKYKVSVLLKEPPLPKTDIVPGDSPSTGPEDAPVTIIEYSDYLCPSCRRNHGTVKRIREKYKGKIRWIFKDYPLSMHRGARPLALAAHCAEEQGKFWEYQDLLFSGKKKPGPEDALNFAGQLGLDYQLFGECVTDDSRMAKIETKIEEARESGIGATPTIIINGRLQTGVPPFEKFCKLIDEALADQ